MLESFLREFLIIFAVSTAVTLAFRLVKLPSIVGFIISGVIVGPSGFGFISETQTIQQIAELGLVFLLFSIGVEFSLKNLLQMKRVIIGGGGLQFFLVTVSAMGVMTNLGHSLRESFLVGSMIALSSTAIVLKALHERRELASPHGNLAVGILLFQDLMVVPLMLMISFLGKTGTQTETATQDWLEIFGKGVVLIGFIVLGARYVIPALFKAISRSGSRELFIISVALLIFFSAWISHRLGLSLALGAFIAGILISDSPYGYQATADMVAWREPLVAIFFVSVGMLLDLKFFIAHPLPILATSIGVLLGKTILNSIAGSLIGTMQRASIVCGLMLSQVGEFSFILADSARQLGVIQSEEYQFLLSVIVMTLLISPLIINFTPLIAPRLIRTDLFGQLIEGVVQDRNQAQVRARNQEAEEVRDHVIIVGFGNNGRNLASALRLLGIPYRVIESNAATLREFQNEPLFFGDGGKPEMLERVGISSARAVVITINDSIWVNKIVSAVRKMRPELNLIVRLQYFLDAERVKDITGLDKVIAEAETAKQIVRKVLGIYKIAPQEIESIVGA
jgi:CPA2 family monovalent cation:H+ antiporter-2